MEPKAKRKDVASLKARKLLETTASEEFHGHRLIFLVYIYRRYGQTKCSKSRSGWARTRVMCAQGIFLLYVDHCIWIIKRKLLFTAITFILICYKRHEHYDIAQIVGGRRTLRYQLTRDNKIGELLSSDGLRWALQRETILTADDRRGRTTWQCLVSYRSKSIHDCGQLTPSRG